jgi:uncharacterized protein YggU (UPF0235/DUF167 family)
MPAQLTLRLQLKVIAGASRPSVEWFGDKLKVKVNAAPEKGRANVAVCALLASTLKLPISAVRIVAGEQQALKTVELSGLTLADVRMKIS